MAREGITPLGIIRDIQAWELGAEPVWTAGKNINCRTGFARSVADGVAIFQGTNPIPADPVYMVPSISFDLFAWLYGTDDGAAAFSFRVTDGVAHKLITPAPFIPWPNGTNALTQGSIDGKPVINWQNQSGYWDRDFVTPSVMVLLDGAPLCKAMRSHQNRLLALNTIDDATAPGPFTEETVRWSSLPRTPGVPPAWMPEAVDWIPAIDNSAGDAQLSGGGPLVDGASLRSSFVVYSSSRAWIMDEVGGSFVFSIRKLSESTGVISRNCIAATPLGHVVFSGDDIYINDGTNFRSIIDNQNKLFLYRELGDNFQNCWVAFYAARSEVWFAYPTGQDLYPSRALIWDIGTGKWGHRELKLPSDVLGIAHGTTGPVALSSQGVDPTWDGQGAGTWDDGTYNRGWNTAIAASSVEALVMADPKTRILTVDGLIQGDAAPLFNTSEIYKHDMDMGDASRRKQVKRIWPRVDRRIDPAGPLQVFVGARDTLDSSTIRGIGTPINFDPAIQDNVSCDIQGRYISVGFAQQSQDKGVYTVNGFDIEYSMGGRF